ncbi:toxin-antitoxin system YwqK family antitoxin [Winogradskyella forsetii]|uniref:toxin-antitoxin system YwqK family antitoxin n=1 Tax=Winogradskyella forsetii TaxID=2686077 RepID=UPI0015BBA540|nr:nicotinic acid mononucleotide adenyltransferase [Winogradskyella forsetii]
MKKIAILLIMLSVTFTYAQKERNLKLNKETNLIEVVYYHDNGEISQTGTYTLDGKLQGDWFSYSNEGNKLASAKYDNGEKVGKWFYWSEGSLKEVDYSNNAVASVNVWTDSKTSVASNR